MQHKDPYFREIQDQINMSQPVVRHFNEGIIYYDDIRKLEEPENRRPPDQDPWNERIQTKELARKS